MKKKKIRLSANWNTEFWAFLPTLFLHDTKNEVTFGLLFLNFGIGVLINKNKKTKNGKTNDKHN